MSQILKFNYSFLPEVCALLHWIWFEYGEPKKQFFNKLLAVHYFLYCLKRSSNAYCITDRNAVAGFILLKLKSKKPRFFMSKPLFKVLGVFLSLFAQCSEGLKVHALYAYNYAKLQQDYPTEKYDAEIVLLIIDPKLQGKGLGKKLIDFAIKKVRKEGAQNVFLLTDTSCNYKFYDLLMFKKVAKRKGGYLYEGQESPEYFFVYEKNL
nr:GNAT family N-acetyltransferase [uncultured Succinatimonas sp.]